MAALATAVLAASLVSVGPAAANTEPGAARPASSTSTTTATTAKPRTAKPLDSAPWMTLEASRNTVNGLLVVNGSNSSTLSVYSSLDVGPTPYYIQIWDLTANTLVAACGSGTACSASVSQTSTTTHAYVATVALYASSYPPTGVQATSMTTYVAWVFGLAPYYSVSMTGLSLDYPPYDGVLTATSSADVGSTPYYIEIFDVTKGTLVTECGTGTQCVGTVSYADSFDTHVAFISGYGSTLPPPNIRAASNSM